MPDMMLRRLLICVWPMLVCCRHGATDSPKQIENRPTTQATIEKPLQTVFEPELREELLKRKAEDQKARTASPFDVADCMRIDEANTARMKEIVEKYGWPGKSIVGADGAFAAWLLVQHADADPDFQAYCLELMKEAFESNE